MGSLFRYREWKRLKPPTVTASTVRRVPLAEALAELRKPMVAPEVDLCAKLPAPLVPRLAEVVSQGCRAFLVEPEEEVTRWFGMYDTYLEELDRTPVCEHKEYLRNLVSCVGGAITVGESRYRLESFVSFNEFGDRFTLQFVEEGVGDLNDAILLRQQNVRLVNRLKPATALTAKNEVDVADTVLNNQREPSFTEVLLQEGLITEESLQAVPKEPQNDYLLRLIKAHIFPRKLMATALARYLNANYIDVEIQDLDKEVARNFSEEWELTNQVIPYSIIDNRAQVAMMDPTRQDVIDAISEKLGLPCDVFCVAAQDVVSVVRRAHKKDD